MALATRRLLDAPGQCVKFEQSELSELSKRTDPEGCGRGLSSFVTCRWAMHRMTLKAAVTHLRGGQWPFF